MNGEIPSVPITTLAGISSLTDLLPELPLPTPNPATVNNKSLLYHPRIAEEARRVLATRDENLIAQLTHALCQTNIDHIELKDNLASDAIEGEIPELLKGVLALNPNVFKGGMAPHGGLSNHQPLPPHPFHPQQQHSPYQSHNMSPYTPGSPARFPPQIPPVGSPYMHQGSPHHQTQSSPYHQPAQHTHAASANQFQQQFAGFAARQGMGAPAVNGENSPSTMNSSGFQQQFLSHASGQNRTQNTPKPATVSSPAQATAVPTPPEPTRSHTSVKQPMVQLEKLSNIPTTSNEPKSQSKARRQSSSSSKSNEPVVLLEPLDVDEIHQLTSPRGSKQSSESSTSKSSKNVSGQKSKTMAVPTLKLTRLEDDTSTKLTLKKHGDSYSISKSGDLTMKLSKNREDRGSKRRRSDPDYEDPDDIPEIVGGYVMSLSERIKKRRRQASSSTTPEKEKAKKSRQLDYSSDEDVRPISPVDIPRSAKKKKDKHKHVSVPTEKLSIEELMDSATFKRFNRALEVALEMAEEADVANISDLDLDDDTTECPPECLLAKHVLNDLCSEAAKLKTMGVMNQVPYDRLVKLLTVLQWNIRDGAKVLPNIAQDTQDEEEERLWRELTSDRLLRSIDAALTALYVMTSPDMPKQVYIEDVIDRVVMLSKFQLTNTIYPEFDPVYKIDPKSKEFHGSIKMKRARAHGAKHKSTITLYNKLSEIVGNLAELIEIQELTDTVILQVSTLGVTPFFVENISELQLNAMKVVNTVYSKYEKHRKLIVEDIFSSLTRLPSSKRNLRSYRLNADESIQMMTALVLQLIQSVISLPTPQEETRSNSPSEDTSSQKRGKNHTTDDEVVIVGSYENAMRSGHGFLSVFLNKCSSKGEEDYRPLFENFVQDLLSTVNKPEWPAAELLLSLLGRLLVKQFSNKSVDMSLRVASLDYLGIVASRLRRDAVNSKLNQESIDEIIAEINDDSDDDSSATGRKTPNSDKQGDQTQTLQKAMLDYLAYNVQSDPALVYARQFYIAQWFRDATTEAEKTIKEKHKRSEEEEDSNVEEIQRTNEVLQAAEKRKQALLNQTSTMVGPLAANRPVASKLDYESACLVARYLASNRPFSQSFDIYLTQILQVLCETAVAVRTKAMKCLTAVIEADPGILARPDMQRGVHGRFLDQSTSVREAALDLVGKFILIRPELTEQYYEMMSDRILDTGISVRKRVIKIFRDICLEQPDFQKIPEMCVKMIRRVNDEEGIKKLVNEVFQSMWFSPVRDKDSHKLLKKVLNITDVVAACKDTGYEWFETLLSNLLRKEEEASHTPVYKSCTQIVDCLVDNVLRLEEKAVELTEGKVTSSQRLVACLSTLYLFCKVKPEFLVKHAETLQPYLSIKCSTQGDYLVLHNIARILELVVPMMEHPSEGFLAGLEEDMMKLILKHGMMVVQSCVSCLGAVVNNVSHNFKLVRDCFQKFFGVLCKLLSEHKHNPRNPALQSSRPTLLRSLFTVGLLARSFDFDSKEMGETKVCVRDKVFDVLMYFISHEDEEVKHKALTGIGYMCIRHYEFMLGTTLKQVYQGLLGTRDSSIKLKIQVLRNLQNYLIEEENKMSKADAEWKKNAEKEDLKDMCDIQSGMASTIMQVYLKQTLEAFFHSQAQVRMTALSVIQLILRQGLVHPVQCVPYLISMGTDCEATIRLKADQQLQEIDKKYPGFVHMKAMAGIRKSFQLQKLIQQDLYEPVRGIRSEDNPTALLAFLYQSVRGNRHHRRALLTNMLNMFDDNAKTSLAELLYIADNLAYMPYGTQDEPLYIMHQVDIIVSVSGSNLLQSFKEALLQKEADAENKKIDEDDDEDVDQLLAICPEDTLPMQEVRCQWQGCVLLLWVKQHLKDLYNFKDAKISQYSPTENAKVYEKPVNRKHNVIFYPRLALDLLKSGGLSPQDLDEDGRRMLISNYVEFKQLMNSIDPADDDSDMSTGRRTPVPKSQPNPDGEEASVQSRPVEGVPVEGVAEETPVQPNTTPIAVDPSMRPEVVLMDISLDDSASGISGAPSEARSGVSRSEKKRNRSKPKKEKKKKHKKKKKHQRRYSISTEEDEEEEEEDDSDDSDFYG